MSRTMNFPNVFCEARFEAENVMQDELASFAECYNNTTRNEEHERYLKKNFKYPDYYKWLAKTCLNHFAERYNEITGSNESLVFNFVEMNHEGDSESFTIEMGESEYKKWFDIATKLGRTVENPFEFIINHVEGLLEACESIDFNAQFVQYSRFIGGDYDAFLSETYKKELA